MNDRTDDELRRIAMRAHATALTPDDVAADLRLVQQRIESGEQPTEAITAATVRRTGGHRPRWSRLAVGAIAAAALIVVAIVVADGRHRGPGSIESPASPAGTGAAPSPSTAPATTGPVSTPASTTSAATTVTSTTSAAPTSTAQSLTVDAADPPPMLTPTPFVTLPLSPNPDGGRIEVAIGDTQIAVRQPGDDALTLVDTGSRGGIAPGVSTVALDEPITDLALGPGKVAYGLAPGTRAGEPRRLVAIALDGQRTGQVIATTELDPVTYVELPPLAFGHSITGIVDRARQVNTELMAYVDVDADGLTLGLAPPGPPLPRWSADDTGGRVTLDGSDASWDLTIKTAAGHADEGTGPVPPAPTSGGRVIYTTTIGPTGADGTSTMPVVAVLAADGSGRWVRLPDDWSVATSDIWGTVLMRTTADSLELAMLDDVLAAADTSPDGELTRPVFDVAGCTALWARDGGTSWIDNLFARRSSAPIATQVFGDPADPYNAPFVIVQRFLDYEWVDAQTPGSPPGRTTFNHTSGRSSAEWVLLDGSDAYVNSRYLDDDQLVAFTGRLQPRDAGAAVPGFDLGDGWLGPRMQLLDETVGPIEVSTTAGSACDLGAGGHLQVGILDGRPLGRFAMMLDSPSPLPVAALLPDGRTVLVRGNRDVDLQAALVGVHQATEAQWEALLAQPTS